MLCMGTNKKKLFLNYFVFLRKIGKGGDLLGINVHLCEYLKVLLLLLFSCQHCAKELWLGCE